MLSRRTFLGTSLAVAAVPAFAAPLGGKEMDKTIREIEGLSKADKARALGVTMLDEAALRALIGN